MPVEKIADLTNQLFEIANAESIAPTEVPAYVKRKIEEKQRIEAEIQKAGAILHDTNVNIQTIEEYKKFEEELKKHGLSMEYPRRLVSILQTIDETGCDPKKIISELARIKSLRQTERQLNNDCRILESRESRYKEIISMCEQIVSFGIGFPELATFHAAVLKKSDTEGLPNGCRAVSYYGGYRKL